MDNINKEHPSSKIDEIKQLRNQSRKEINHSDVSPESTGYGSSVQGQHIQEGGATNSAGLGGSTAGVDVESGEEFDTPSKYTL